MPLPRDQRVCDLLTNIADLVQEADEFLCEGKFYKSFSTGKLFSSRKPGKLFVSKARKPRAQSNKDTGPNQQKLAPAGLQPHKADRITNRLRKSQERLDKPARDVLRARRDRQERSRYQTTKATAGKPIKHLGSRLRMR